MPQTPDPPFRGRLRPSCFSDRHSGANSSSSTIDDDADAAHCSKERQQRGHGDYDG